MFGKNRTAQDTLGNDRELLLQAMDKIIAGDFSEVSAEGFRDPIYAEKLNQMIGAYKKANNNYIMRLNEAMQSIGDNSYVKNMLDQVYTQQQSITDMNSSSQILKESIGNISDAMGEIRDNTHDMLQVSQSSAANMNDSITVVNESSQKIADINNQVNAFHEKINKIGEIVDIVKKVASQSNLLALNASIEAARAGEAGKGFAVVADEIRNLSTETEESSDRIMTALGHLEDTSNRMLKSITTILELIQTTQTKVVQVNDSVSGIAKDSTQIGEHIGVVDSAMQEVESSNRNMVDNMHEIENVMKDITDCIGNADESTKIMLSKYEESARNVDKIENVVGAMMEKLGVGGFMGVQDIKQGMYCTIRQIISGKPADNREKYYTFFKFDEMRQTKSLDSIWRSIQQTFLVLKDWHGNHELYHKIGYLIASGTLTLQKIFDLSKDKTKDDFRDSLDGYIRDSIKIKGNYSDLSYEKPLDQKKIATLLLLFNVESVRRNGEHSQWFPFDKYKFGRGGKVTWSLEHIHAQQSEGLRTQEMWKEWLTLHIPSVKSVSDDSEELIELMNSAIAKDKLERQEFDAIQQRVVDLLSGTLFNQENGPVQGNLFEEFTPDHTNEEKKSNLESLNSLSYDYQLIDTEEKRNEIIKMDKAGQYIPFCTRMVFLKYYTPSADNQLHFWGHADRVAYVDAMNTVLVNYLEEPIVLEKEEE